LAHSTLPASRWSLSRVAFLASYIPALRAMRADPMLALAHNA
jgi:hypothetical protein